MSTDNIIRKAQTGEPGNGGQFGSHARTAGAVTLEPLAKQPGEYETVDRHDWLDRDYTAQVNCGTGLTDDEFKSIGDHYLAAALWSTSAVDEDGNDFDLDSEYSIYDFSTEARTRADQDLYRFVAANKDSVHQALATKGYDGGDGSGAQGMVGHDLWLTRNGHGAGFWDRSALSGELGRELTAGAKALNEVIVEVGDDGKLYFL